MQTAMGGKVIPGAELFGAMEEQARNNMTMFSQAFTMFNPFAAAAAGTAAQGGDKTAAASSRATAPEGDIDLLKKQLADMQAKIDGLARK